MSANARPTTTRTLHEDDQAAVRALADRAEAADGVSPLDDQVRLEITHGASGSGAHHLVHADDELVAYAHLDTAADDGSSGHLVVAPEHRRRGCATALIDHLSGSPGALRLWAHGDLPPAQGLARRLGWSRDRELLQLHRPLDGSVTAPDYPAGVTVRTFEVGRDEQAWLDVNARAFADHPEQGRVTMDDLRHREQEPWFDPSGFFLAERDDDLLGFHWTKVHRDSGGDRAYGEVYVVGVDPDAQGLGLGRRLTATGLAHLADLGLREVRLYVDGDNGPAVAVYERLGFTRLTVDVMYASA